MHRLLELDYHAAGATERLITALVVATLEDASEPATHLVERLRTLEISARRARAEPQMLQVVASGRRLLGDTEDLSWASTRH